MTIEQYKQKINDLFLDKYKFTHKLVDRVALFQILVKEAKKLSLHAYSACFEGYIAWFKQDSDLAISNFNKALELDEKLSYAWNGLGFVYFKLDNFDQALKCFQKAIQLNDSFAYSCNAIGAVYYVLNDYQNAKACFEKAINIDKNYASPWHNLGKFYAELKEYDKARSCYKKAISIDNNWAYPWNGLGRLFYDLKEFDKAKEHYDKAIQLDPDFYPAIFNLGLLFFEEEEFSKAEPYLQIIKEKCSLTKDEYFVSRAEDLLNRIQEIYNAERQASRRQALFNPMEKILSITKEKRLADEAARNQESYLQFLTEPNNLVRLPEEDYFLILRRWNSYTPIVADNFHSSKGGGYFLKVNHKGIVIDPGFNFIDNFRGAKLFFHEIDIVLISHAHNDHTADLESILTLLSEYNSKIKDSSSLAGEDTIRREIASKEKKKPEKVSTEEIEKVFLSSPRRKTIDFYLTASVFKKYVGLFDLFSKNDYRLHIVEPGYEKELIPNVRVHFLYAKHDDIISDQNSTGFYIKFKDDLVLIYTGDTGWNDFIEHQYQEIGRQFAGDYRLLIAHIGGVKKEEDLFWGEPNKEKAFYPNHLGRLGLCRINESLKPNVCIISEFGEELRLWRQELADIYQDAFDNKTIFIPGDIGLKFNLNNRKIWGITEANLETGDLTRGNVSPENILSILLRKDFSLHFYEKYLNINKEDLIQIISHDFDKSLK